MSTVPLRLSAAASAWLSRLPEKTGQELGFVCSPRYGVYRGSELIESFTREHYAFVHAKPDVWSHDRAAIRFIIHGKPFWLMPELLESLSAKTLDIVRVDVGQGRHAGIFREFLVALGKEEPNQPVQRNASTGSVLNFESPARRG